MFLEISLLSNWLCCRIFLNCFTVGMLMLTGSSLSIEELVNYCFEFWNSKLCVWTPILSTLLFGYMISIGDDIGDVIGYASGYAIGDSVGDTFSANVLVLLSRPLWPTL